MNPQQITPPQTHFLYSLSKHVTWSRCVVSAQRSEAASSSAGCVLVEGTWSWSYGTAWPEDADSWQPSPAPPWWSGWNVLWPCVEPPCPDSTESQPQTHSSHGTHGTCCACQNVSHNAARCQSSWSWQGISLESSTQKLIRLWCAFLMWSFWQNTSQSSIQSVSVYQLSVLEDSILEQQGQVKLLMKFFQDDCHIFELYERVP